MGCVIDYVFFTPPNFEVSTGIPSCIRLITIVSASQGLIKKILFSQ